MELAEYQELMRLTPNNTEAEAALLGALMIDNRMVGKLPPALEADHFFEPTHARIFDRIQSLVAAGQQASPITLRPYFDGEETTWVGEDGKDQVLTIPQYLAKLTGSGAGLLGATYMAEQVTSLFLHRELIQAGKDLVERAANTGEMIDPREVMQETERRLAEIGGAIPTAERTGADWEEAFEDTIKHAQAVKDGLASAGLKVVGYDDFVEVCGQIGDTDMILLGGRPSMGKTAVACKIATSSAMAGEATDFLSLEMEKPQISIRMMADAIFDEQNTSTYSVLKSGQWTRSDHRAIAEARDRIAGKPLHIDAPRAMYIEDLVPWIRLRQRAWAAKGHKMRLLVIDYLDRFRTKKQFSGETERVSYISRCVKEAGKDCGIVIVLLCQLSRDVEKREDKHPIMSDLRQSGSLEQDADVVLFVYRDEYYLRTTKPKASDAVKLAEWEDEMTAAKNLLELYSVKVREGAPTKRTGYYFTDRQAVRDSLFYTDSGYVPPQDEMKFEDLAQPA